MPIRSCELAHLNQAKLRLDCYNALHSPLYISQILAAVLPLILLLVLPSIRCLPISIIRTQTGWFLR